MLNYQRVNTTGFSWFPIESFWKRALKDHQISWKKQRNSEPMAWCRLRFTNGSVHQHTFRVCLFSHLWHEARHGYVEESLLQAPDPLFLVYWLMLSLSQLLCWMMCLFIAIINHWCMVHFQGLAVFCVVPTTLSSGVTMVTQAKATGATGTTLMCGSHWEFDDHLWRFPKMGVPPIIHFNGTFHLFENLNIYGLSLDWWSYMESSIWELVHWWSTLQGNVSLAVLLTTVTNLLGNSAGIAQLFVWGFHDEIHWFPLHFGTRNSQ